MPDQQTALAREPSPPQQNGRAEAKEESHSHAHRQENDHAPNGHAPNGSSGQAEMTEAVQGVLPAGSKPPLGKVLEDLAKPVPKRLLKTRRVQGQEITYVPWYRAQKILNHYTRGFWEYEIIHRAFTPPRSQGAGQIMLTVRIIVHAAEGSFHREGTGIERLDVESYGDPQSNAESMAFRRACAHWGLAINLYEGKS